MLSDQPGKEPSRDGACIYARLVQANRARPCCRTVIVADQRHGCRKVKRLSDPFERPHAEQAAKTTHRGGRHADCAPGVEAAKNCRLAPHAIHDVAGEQRTEAIDPREGAAEQAQLHVIETHRFLQQRKNGEDGLAIGVIEKRDAPKHRYHLPAIPCAQFLRISHTSQTCVPLPLPPWPACFDHSSVSSPDCVASCGMSNSSGICGDGLSRSG